jgi:hypothetical protein
MRSSASGSARTTWWPPRRRSDSPLSKAAGSKLRRSRAYTSSSRTGMRVELEAAGVDAGDVQQLAEEALQRIDRVVDAAHEVGQRRLVHALAQRLREQAHGVQGLSQVVAGGGEELSLGPVGRLGLLPRGLGLRLLARSCAARSRCGPSATACARVRRRGCAP